MKNIELNVQERYLLITLLDGVKILENITMFKKSEDYKNILTQSKKYKQKLSSNFTKFKEKDILIFIKTIEIYKIVDFLDKKYSFNIFNLIRFKTESENLYKKLIDYYHLLENSKKRKKNYYKTDQYGNSYRDV